MVGSAPHFLRTPTPTSPLHSQKFYAAITPFHATSAGSNSFTFRIRSPVQSSGDRGRDRLQRPLRSVRRHGRRPSDLPSGRRPRGARWGRGDRCLLVTGSCPRVLVVAGGPAATPSCLCPRALGRCRRSSPRPPSDASTIPTASRSARASAQPRSNPDPIDSSDPTPLIPVVPGHRGSIAVLSPNMMILGDSTMARIQEGCIRHQFFFQSTQSLPRGAGAMLSRTPHRRAAR